MASPHDRPKSVDQLIAEARSLVDPARALTRLRLAREAADATTSRLNSLTVDLIEIAREVPMTWNQIAELLGVSKTRAQQLADVRRRTEEVSS